MDWFANGMLAAAKRKGGALPDPFISNVYYMANYTASLTPEINLAENGVTTLGTPVLANGGVEFNGSGDYLETATGCCPPFGANSFTIEAWVQSDSVLSYGGVVGATGLNWVAAIDSYANFQLYTPNTGWISSGGVVRIGGQKIHIALSYTSSTGHLSFYRNGSRIGSPYPVTLSITNGTKMHIGNFSGYYLGGTLYSLRITTGLDRYSGPSYTVPPESFQEINDPLVADPLFSDVSFLSNYTTNADDIKGHATTLTGGATVGGGLMHLNGSSAYLTTPYASVNTDVCIEGWFVLDNWATGAVECLWDTRPAGGAPGTVLYRIGSTFYLYFASNNRITAAMPAYTNGTQVHIATQITTNGTDATATVWWNGVRVSNTAVVPAVGPYAFIHDRLLIGIANTLAYPLDGHVNSFRITNGVRYAHGPSITVPPFTFPEFGP